MRRLAALVSIAFYAAFAGAASASPQHATVAPLCKAGYYKNVDGKCVHRPAKDPVGATAKCRDNTYSYSLHASGTCSHHGGVARWIHHP
ncbi:MAG TPA: DUF3761 domain-containing protein [Polyangiaceae bacterium]|nr:DUF3761 domain-containing protein [Polyangiaceae bacterium]